MKIVGLEKKNIKQFIAFADELYKGDVKYVPYIHSDLKKTLNKLVVEEQNYFGLLALDGNDKVIGRVLYTIAKDKHLDSDKCGFFSMYECIDDDKVSRLLLSEMEEDLKKKGAEYISGTYFPYDEDNRRGILVDGFNRAPLIFTSYNKTYYDRQMKSAGYEKKIDALEFAINMNEDLAKRLSKISRYVKKKYDFRVDFLNMKNTKRDIDDACEIMKAASNDIIFQEAPSKEAIDQIFSSWSNFVEPKLIAIARENKNDKAIGLIVCLPDYFEVFRKINGNINLFTLPKMMKAKKEIHSARAMLQYVVPKYQKKGTLAAMYDSICGSCLDLGVTYCEAGTIMENNQHSISPLLNAGCELARRYRIYYKKIR